MDSYSQTEPILHPLTVDGAKSKVGHLGQSSGVSEMQSGSFLPLFQQL